MSNKKTEIENNFEIAKKIALKYGFSDPSEFVLTKEKKIKTYKPSDMFGETKETLCELLHSYIRSNFHKEKKVKFIFHSNIDKDSQQYVTRKPGLKEAKICLSSIGLNDAFAEAKIISCAVNILNELGYTDLLVKFNSMSDKQSTDQYLKDLTASVYKNIDYATSECIEKLKKSPKEAHKFIHTNNELEEMRYMIPSYMKYLSEKNKIHLQETIEYMDDHDIPYTLSADLFENTGHTMSTLFEIIDTKTNQPIALGGRYDKLSNTFFKRSIEVVNINFLIDVKHSGKYVVKKTRSLKPKIFLFHCGISAKKKILSIVSKLEKEGIHVAHKAHLNTVSEQLTESDGRKFPYILVLGQQEILENNIRIKIKKSKIIKNIPINKLAQNLKLITRLHK